MTSAITSSNERTVTRRSDDYLTPCNDKSNYLTPGRDTAVTLSKERSVTRHNADYLPPCGEKSNATMTSYADQGPFIKDDYLTPSNENSNYLTPTSGAPMDSKRDSSRTGRADDCLTPSNDSLDYLAPVKKSYPDTRLQPIPGTAIESCDPEGANSTADMQPQTTPRPDHVTTLTDSTEPIRTTMTDHPSDPVTLADHFGQHPLSAANQSGAVGGRRRRTVLPPFGA
jgi:hypothetical protein